MLDLRRCWPVAGVVLLGAGVGANVSARGAEEGPPALEQPVAAAELLPDPPTAEVAVQPADGPMHEAFLAPETSPGRVRAPKSPPPPIVERPADDRPSPEAQWVAGYWTWNPAAGDFAWVSGAWRVPPRDKIWVNGRWQRDADGWSRVPGFWSARQGPASAPAPPPVLAENPEPVVARTWKTTGPPADHPADEPGPAPDPNAFYVPGHYTPDGARVAWTRGFWARLQPGWDWVPARWVRRPDGWDYREGSWVRDPSAVRHDVARPASDGPALPPAIVNSEPEPARAQDRPAARDPIAEAEDAAAKPDPAPVVVVPRAAPYPYVVPQPYGYYYYYPMSPRAYVPFGVMPPFARRILNRVLP